MSSDERKRPTNADISPLPQAKTRSNPVTPKVTRNDRLRISQKQTIRLNKSATSLPEEAPPIPSSRPTSRPQLISTLPSRPTSPQPNLERKASTSSQASQRVEPLSAQYILDDIIQKLEKESNIDDGNAERASSPNISTPGSKEYMRPVSNRKNSNSNEVITLAKDLKEAEMEKYELKRRNKHLEEEKKLAVKILKEEHDKERQLWRQQMRELAADKDTLHKQMRRMSEDVGNTESSITIEALKQKNRDLALQLDQICKEKEEAENAQKDLVKHQEELISSLEDAKQSSRSVENTFDRDEIIQECQAMFEKEKYELLKQSEDAVVEKEKLESQVHQLERENQTYLKDLESLQDLIKSQDLKVEELLRKKDEANLNAVAKENDSLNIEKELENLVLQNDKLNDEKKEMSEKLLVLQKQVEDLENNVKERSDISTELKDLEEQLGQLKKEKKQLEENLKETKDKLDSSESELKKLQADRDSLTAQSEGFLKEIKSLEKSNHSLEEQLSEEISAHKETEKKLANAEDSVATREDGAKEQIETLEKERQLLKDSLDSAVSRNETLASHTEDLQKKLLEYDDALGVLEDSKTALEAQVETLQIELETERDNIESKTRGIVQSLSSTHSKELESIQLEVDRLQVELKKSRSTIKELEDVEASYQKLRSRVQGLESQLHEKDIIFRQMQTKLNQKITAEETASKEKTLQIRSLEKQVENLSEELTRLHESRKEENSSLRVVKSTDEDDLELLREKLNSVEEDRINLMDTQNELMKKQMQYVNSLSKMQDEMDDMKKDYESRIEMLLAEVKDAQQENFASTSTTKTRDVSDISEDTVQLANSRVELEQWKQDYQQMEEHWTNKIQEVQKRLNETTEALERIKVEREEIEKELTFKMEAAEIEARKTLEEKDALLKEKEQEIKHMIKHQNIHGQIRRQMRHSETVHEPLREEPEESEEVRITREVMSSSPSRPRSDIISGKEKADFLKKLETLKNSEKQSQEGSSSVHALSKDPQMTGNPLDYHVDPRVFQIQTHVKLSDDPKILQEQVHKLLSNIGYLRNGILKTQAEIDKIRKENDELKEDLLYLHSVLEQDRANANKSIEDWEEWATSLQSDFAYKLSLREEQIEMLKAELELAKEEWSKIVLRKEEVILKLAETRRSFLQEAFTDISIHFKQAQKRLEEIINDDDEIYDSLMLVNLSERRKEALSKEFFGDLSAEVEKRFGSGRYDHDMPDTHERRMSTHSDSGVEINTTARTSAVSLVNSVASDGTKMKGIRRWSLW